MRTLPLGLALFGVIVFALLIPRPEAAADMRDYPHEVTPRTCTDLAAHLTRSASPESFEFWINSAGCDLDGFGHVNPGTYGPCAVEAFRLYQNGAHVENIPGKLRNLGCRQFEDGTYLPPQTPFYGG